MYIIHKNNTAYRPVNLLFSPSAQITHPSPPDSPHGPFQHSGQPPGRSGRAFLLCPSTLPISHPPVICPLLLLTIPKFVCLKKLLQKTIPQLRLISIFKLAILPEFSLIQDMSNQFDL